MATYWENSCSFGLRYVSWYKYPIVSLFFSHLGFWSGYLFLIAPFPDLCLLVPFYRREHFALSNTDFQHKVNYYVNNTKSRFFLFVGVSFVLKVEQDNMSIPLTRGCALCGI